MFQSKFIHVPRSLQQLQIAVFHSFSNFQTSPVGCFCTVLKLKKTSLNIDQQFFAFASYTIGIKEYSIELEI